MHRILYRLRDGEHGMLLVFVGLGFLAFLGATMLAVDVGMFMTARAQAQNSADAGALAGAVALVFDDFEDRTPQGPVVQNALAAAQANPVMSRDVSISPDDVTFPAQEQVRATVYRTGERGNPLGTLIASYFGVPTADVSATATAEAIPANAATCVKPWAVPDKWNERQTPPWDGDDTFDLFEPGQQAGGRRRIPNPDEYVPASQPNYTGYQQSPQGPDYGRQVLLKPGNPQQAVSASDFFPIALPPGTGADWYAENIPGCWPGTMQIGDAIPVEPGNMTGPTTDGTQWLIDRDPTAYWDEGRRRVISNHSPSPRIIVIPVFDPEVFEESRQHGRQEILVANLVGFFVEGLQGTSVVGRVVPMTGLLRGGAPLGAFLRAIRLVR